MYYARIYFLRVLLYLFSPVRFPKLVIKRAVPSCVVQRSGEVIGSPGRVVYPFRLPGGISACRVTTVIGTSLVVSSSMGVVTQ